MSALLKTLLDVTPRKNKRRKIVVCTHAKFSCIDLCQKLIDSNHEVTFYPVDYSKETSVIDVLLSIGVEVVEQKAKLLETIKVADCAIEDGARISKIINKHKIKTKLDFYTVEQTSGGIRYFEENPPLYPVINVAKSAVKLHIENSIATPEGVLQCFSKATGDILSGKKVLVIGYGSIGEGIARLAHTMGAHITIYDSLATKRLFATRQGFRAIEKKEFNTHLPDQDIIFMATNTYQGTLLDVEQILLMRNGAKICNAGSGRGEVATTLHEEKELHLHDAEIKISKHSGDLIVECKKNNETKTITILAEAFPINLHLGHGTSHDAIEIVMALLLLAAIRGPEGSSRGLQPLNHDIQETVAEIVLTLNGQKDYLKPTHVKTNQLDKLMKPYGEIYPFHNHLGNSAHISVARVIFNPDTKTRGHYHKRTQESYYVEAGEANIHLWPAEKSEKPQSYVMKPGDYLLVPENYFHDVDVTSKTNFECLVIASPSFQPWDQFFNETEHK